MKYIFKPAFSLFLVAVIITALLSFARGFTLEPIEYRRKLARDRTMNEVFSEASEFREYTSGIPAGNIIGIYEGFRSNEKTGYVIELAPEGYSGEINMMVGISLRDEKITGMRILRHTETPGLGAFATREEFFRKFDNKKLQPLKVVRTPASADDEIQAITGATITSKAVTGAVNEAIGWFRNRER